MEQMLDMMDQFYCFPPHGLYINKTEIYYCAVQSILKIESWMFSGLNGEGGMGVV